MNGTKVSKIDFSKSGRPKTPRIEIENAILIFKRYYLDKKKRVLSYTLRDFAKDLNVKYGTLKYWFWKEDRPSIAAWNKFETLPASKDIIDKFGKILTKEILTIVPRNKIRVCRRKGCNNEFILFAHNRLDCDEHRNKSLIKYPVK